MTAETDGRRHLPLLMRRLGWGVLVLVLSCHAPAGAVIVFERGKSRPTVGYLVRQDESQVVIQQVEEGPRLPRPETLPERAIPRAGIEDLLVSVAAERLAELRPDNPKAYRDYAEELAEKRKDPDARVTGIRLFLIAAHLDRQQLGRSSLLGMIGLARDPIEEQKFRAIAYLLDPDHDRAVLKQPTFAAAVAPPASAAAAPAAHDRLLPLVRAVRRGNKKGALAAARQPEIVEQLGLYASIMSREEFETACSPVCTFCRTGYITCSACSGTGRIGGPTRPRCEKCSGGKVRCPQCQGNFQHPELSRDLLRRLLLLEAALTGPTPSVSAPAAPAGETALWSATAARSGTQPVPVVTLETLTEFDPAECVFRDGRWTRPEETSSSPPPE